MVTPKHPKEKLIILTLQLKTLGPEGDKPQFHQKSVEVKIANYKTIIISQQKKFGYSLIEDATMEKSLFDTISLYCIKRGQATVVINMMARQSRACKRKINFSQFDSDDSEPDPFLNESEDDKDYTESKSSSDSEDTDSRTVSL